MLGSNTSPEMNKSPKKVDGSIDSPIKLPLSGTQEKNMFYIEIDTVEPFSQNTPQETTPEVSGILDEITGTIPQTNRSICRSEQARACLVKAKTNLAYSRNIKSEIKEAVTKAIEQMYKIVKESEAELEVYKKSGTKAMSSDLTQIPNISNLTNEKKSNENGNTDQLKKTLNEHAQAIKENNEKMDKLRQLLEINIEAQESRTYAAVAAQPITKTVKRPTTIHSVIVTSKNEAETGEEVLNRIRTVVRAKEDGIKIDNIRKAKDRKVILGCKTEEDRDKIREKLGNVKDQLQVEEMKNKNPLVIIKNVLAFHTNEEIIIALKNQNKSIYSGLKDGENKTEILYRKKTRNELTSHIVMRVSPQLWLRMTELGHVHIDLQRVRVEDQSPLVQCSMCLAYGHGRRYCTEEVPKCSHCGDNHMKSECPDLNKVPSCTNCVRAKCSKRDHNAFSSECPVRRKWDSLARSAIAYC